MLSPALNWRGAGHTILGLFGLLTFVPGLNVIGIASNAAWYFSEGNIFQEICSGLAALPGIGKAVGKIGSAGSKLSYATSLIQKGTQIASNVGFMGTGAYTIGKMGYDNYHKYVVRGEGFSFWNFAGDAVNGVLAVLSIYGGAKDLGFDKVNVSNTSKSSSEKIKPFLTEDYYQRKIDPNTYYQEPNTSRTFIRWGEHSQSWKESIIVSDNYGRIKYRIDYSDHGMHNCHTNPHIHEYKINTSGTKMRNEDGLLWFSDDNHWYIEIEPPVQSIK